MRVKVGGVWHSSRDGYPIMVELRLQDKVNIADMPDSNDRYAVFQIDDPLFDTAEKKYAWMDEGAKKQESE